MDFQNSIHVVRPAGPNSDIDSRRHAAWLHSNYSDPIWIISDSRDSTKRKKVDFRFMLPDGRLLIEDRNLYATAKEYAWWVRDPRYSRFETAVSHFSQIMYMFNIIHAMVLRGIRSFSAIQPFDIDQFIEDFRFGADAVLRASDRLQIELKRLSDQAGGNLKYSSSVPMYYMSGKFKTDDIDYTKLLLSLNIPANANRLPRVCAVVKRMSFAHGFKDNVNNEDVIIPDLQPITSESLLRWLMVFQQLYAMRRKIQAESICFRPFPYGAQKVAAVKGVGVGRTPTAPPLLALHLLEHSARWVLDAPDSVPLISGSREEVFRLATACWILIAAFSARRDGEIDDLRHGCLQGDDATGWWLHIYIEKTLQRREWIPVPPLVARAVQLLSALSEAAREKTKTDELFQWLQPSGKVVRLDVGRHLDDFAEAVNVPLHRKPGEVPVAWHWTPHQFRRFFAVLYFYRFEGATIEALSHHLRHFSLEMTRRYITEDPEVAALWTDVEWGYMGHVARTIVAGERSVSGAAGERLKKTAKRLIDTFRRTLQIASPERAGASLIMIMQRQGLVLTPKPWVTCSCPKTRDAALKAACRRGRNSDPKAIGPDFAQAGPSVCPFCPYAIIEGERAAFVESEVKQLTSFTTSGVHEGTLFGALEQARVVELRLAHKLQYQEASPLGPLSGNLR